VTFPREEEAMSGSKLLDWPALGVAVALLGGPADPAAAQSNFWAGKTALFEDVLKNGQVTHTKDLGTGANEPKKLTLEKDGRTLHALWKPIERGKKEWAWESHQAEVAAYELDKMLGLGMVPPTVLREHDGQTGSLQLWVENCRLFSEVGGEAPSDPDRWERQMSRMRVFDNLISNWDRSPKNFMIDDQWSVVLIDHSQAFLSTRELSPNPEQLPDRFDRKLVDALRTLEPEFLRVRFGRLLLEPQVSAISARRDALLLRLKKLIVDRGEKAVVF
jgi:hypothetical protein